MIQMLGLLFDFYANTGAGQKNETSKLMAIILSNLNRFTNLFHCKILW